MVTIKLKGDATLGAKICEALVGNRAFVENDIIVNYDTPGDIFIVLGDETHHNIELDVELKN